MSKLTFCFVFLAVALAVGCYVLQKLVDRMIETRLRVEEMAKDLKKKEETLLAKLESRDLEMKLLSDDLKNNFEERIMYITEKVDNLKGKVENVEIPTVAFSAFNPAYRNLNTLDVLILQSVHMNEGNGYDTKTGKFTAPVRGLYQFTAHVCNMFGYVIHYAIVKNSEWIAASQQFEQANENNNRYASCSSVSALMMLERGEKVWIMCTSGYTNQIQIHEDTYRRNSFIGVLLHR
ncbi:complement C1q and tumor necrosis factor-related protein 9B-like [Mercenaria mercenaria]|uniref:complement C1q and tumor necrosis factor-related protein 9B-like n=1 Tax=Mercenaria mercenaria TaxID=6596 RepID=UPI00234F2678|nr:complement C1q and tumor necrosis factor-related protein 9B-like [Mercenaria mercenaria]